ncbi:MAG: L-threonylcarbamoyladenylate synthase [Lachnospiraceae bacterium]
MVTKVVRIDEQNIDENQIRIAGELAKQGELVAFPTETVYGLGADALNPTASGKIYAAKGRPSDNPLIVHIAEFEALKRIVRQLPKEAGLLADAFWPGPLTMCFNKKEVVPDETTGGLKTVAVRMPDHPIALAFIKAAGGYIAAPSANTSGRPSPTMAEHVFQDMDGKIPMILDGGQVGIGIESTIVDLTEDRITILRPGYITKEMMEQVLSREVFIDPAVDGTSKDARPKAPGMKYRHYAPKAELILVQGTSQKKVGEKMLQLAGEAAAANRRCGIMATSETLTLFENLQLEQERSGKSILVLKSIGHEGDDASVAKQLYKVLREFDEEKMDIIYSESFSDKGVGQAVMNRLIRAAGHKVIHVE